MSIPKFQQPAPVPLARPRRVKRLKPHLDQPSRDVLDDPGLPIGECAIAPDASGRIYPRATS